VLLTGQKPNYVLSVRTFIPYKLSRVHFITKMGGGDTKGYEALQDTFWSTFQAEVGGLSAETIKTIKTARIMGLLRSRGFTKRLANMSPATPIHDDETGRYNMLSLDGFLIDPATRFDDLN
jgi:hypothetical protein